MSRGRLAQRNSRNNGAINKGVGHKIRKPNAKKKTAKKYTDIVPFGELPPSPKVKPTDRVVSAETSPVASAADPDSGSSSAKRFFRSRDLNRKATVVMSKELKLQLTSSGGLVRSAARTRRGPYKNVNVKTPPSRPSTSASTPSRLTDQQRELLAAIDSLGSNAETEAHRPGTPSGPAPAEAEGDTPPLRRSPRKHMAQTPSATEGLVGQRSTPTVVQRNTPSAASSSSSSSWTATAGAGGQSTPLRRSPRKLSRPLPQLAATGTPTHAENEGPTRLTLTPRRSPRKHQHTPQQAPLGLSPAQRSYLEAPGRLEEALLKMEAGEDKENESPQRRKVEEQRPKFYSIFYRRPDGSSGSRGTAGASPSTASPSTGSKNIRIPARPADDGLEQLVIDAGQRQFGVITCSTCALVYTIGDPEDEATHARHHTGYLGALNYTGWKKEREVGSYTDGRIVMVAPKDPPHAWKKVDNVLSIVDAELGFVGIGVRNKEESKVFFYIVGRQIVGCLVAEPVKHGFPVLPRDGAGGVRCSTEPRPCLAGVSRVWVHRDYRRRQLGSRLVEAMKSHFSVTPLRWQDVAFSDPTPDGLEFAAGVTGSQEFLVYNQ